MDYAVIEAKVDFEAALAEDDFPAAIRLYWRILALINPSTAPMNY